MKSSSAPTKWSTSTTSRLPAMAPRVANATARPVATSTSATMPIPMPTKVLAAVESRCNHNAWSSRLATPGIASVRPLRRCFRSGA